MGTEVATSKDFQERLYEKIRADIGALMTDEELKKLVASAMERVWFTPVKRPSSGYREEFDPPRIETLVKELLQPSLTAAMSAWLKEHPAEVTAALDKVLSGGLATSVVRAFEDMLSGQFQTMQYNLQQALQNTLRR